MKTILPITVLLISSLTLTACSMQNKSAQIEKPKKTTAELMRGNSGKSNDKAFRKNHQNWNSVPNHSSYTRTQQNELKGLFPRLPNPDILMYVYPHLSSEGATVPGYSSSFSMYEKNHYALPGEAMSIWQSH